MNVQQKLALAFIRIKLNLLTVFNPALAAKHAFRLFCTPQLKYDGRESDVFSKAEKLSVKLDAGLINGYRVNKGGSRRALILHGFSSTCHNFHGYVPLLTAKGYEVLAFNAPAHGSSEGTTVNALEYAEMVKKVCELYGPVHSFIAHSFGGIAVCLALEKLPHNADTRVVLIAPATETGSAIDHALGFIGIKGNKLRAAMDDLIFTIGGNRTEWYSIRRAVKNIQARILWIHDEDDDVTPVADAVKVQKDANEHIQFIFTKGLGHRMIYRDQSTKNHVAAFL